MSFTVKLNSEPFPNSDFMVIVPPNYSVSFYEITSPNPIPPVLTSSLPDTYPKSLNSFF